MLKVISAIQKSIYEKEHAVLILLDLSSAFDTIDHKILIDCLKNQFLITGSALKWIQSYFKNRTFFVSVNGTCGQNLSVAPVGSVVEWLKHRTDDQHGLGSKPACAILLCSWERHFTALSPAWWS